MENNRLGLSLLEKDTGVPETVPKKFRKHLRVSDVPSDAKTDSTVAASSKSVKRKADKDVVDDDAGKQNKKKCAKIDGVTISSKPVKEVSL